MARPSRRLVDLFDQWMQAGPDRSTLTFSKDSGSVKCQAERRTRRGEGVRCVERLEGPPEEVLSELIGTPETP